MRQKPQLSLSNSGRYRPNEVTEVFTSLRLSRLSVEACLTGAHPFPRRQNGRGEYRRGDVHFNARTFIHRGLDSLWTKRQSGRLSFAHFFMERLEVAYPGLARDHTCR